MKCPCSRKTGLFVVALVVMSLSLTGCFGGGGGIVSYTVSGTVVDGDGTGIDGVVIVVTGGRSTTATTGNGGEYVLTGLTGTCTLTPELHGYVFDPVSRTVSVASTGVDFTGTVEHVEPSVYTLTVDNGTGSGEIAEGDTVTITADVPEPGQAFDMWISSEGGSFDDVYAESTGFTMPGNAVTVTATYRDATMADYFEFDRSTGTITQYHVTGKHGNLEPRYDPEIPSSIHGTAVTVIGPNAFQHAQITSVFIPDSVTTIGEWAFQNNLLANLDIPESVTTIGDFAFATNRLTSIDIPDGITVIESGMFFMNSLTSVTIPYGVTHIGDCAFECNELQTIDISNSVTHIGSTAFGGNHISSVTIPDSVVSISDNAFADNDELTTIILPDNVSVDRRAFYQGYSFNVTSITIGSNVTLGYDLLGENDNSFREAYEATGAGEYARIGSNWVKQ
jgi:hypothetical protein